MRIVIAAHGDWLTPPVEGYIDIADELLDDRTAHDGDLEALVARALAPVASKVAAALRLRHERLTPPPK